MKKKTHSNIPLDNSYGPKEKNNPGEFPFTNGIYSEMYILEIWTGVTLNEQNGQNALKMVKVKNGQS